MKKLYAILMLAFGATMIAQAQCTVTFTYTLNGLTINATATGTGAQSFPAYGWDWGDSQQTINQQSASHTYAAPGTYTVCVVYIDVFDTANCQAQACSTITVTTTGLPELQAFVLDAGAAPNPFSASTAVNFSVTQPAEVEIAVYDVLGKKVCDLFKENVAAGEHTVDWHAANVPAGLYFLQVKSGGVTLNKKVMKQ